jgi:RHS repeat-associated protein
VEKNQEITAQYEYDGNGRRVKKIEWSEDLQDFQTTICVYSGLDIIYEKDANSGEEAIYAYSPRGRIAKSVDGLKDYYHSDFLGSTRLITDENGSVTSETQYKSFGENESGEKSHLFTGKEKDSSELYYFGSRYYDSDIGRFITRDTRFGRKSNPQSFNRYIYCLNNPLKYVDPDGRDPCGPDWLEKNDVNNGGLETNLDALELLIMIDLLEFYIETSSNLHDEWGLKEALLMTLGIIALGIKNPLIGGLVAILYAIFSEFVWEFCHEIWNDPEFRHILSNLRNNTTMFLYDEDYLNDVCWSFIELLIYLASTEYGADWIYKFPNLARLYELFSELLKKKSELEENKEEFEPPPLPPEITIT